LGERRGCGIEEISAEFRRAKGLAKEACSSFDFGRGAVEKGQSLVKAVELRWSKGSGSSMGFGEGEDLCLCFVEVDAERGAQSLESLNEDGEVFVWEEREGIIEIGMGCTFRAAAVVTRVVVSPALLCSGAEDGIEWGEYLEDDEAGECGRERVALGKAIFLDEEVEGAVWAVKEAFVWSFIHEIEVMEETMQRRFRFDFVSGSLA
jgi:hypothetical protein